jgi:hypothetical protein
MTRSPVQLRLRALIFCSFALSSVDNISRPVPNNGTSVDVVPPGINELGQVWATLAMTWMECLNADFDGSR